MSQSVSISFGLVFLATLLMGSILYTTYASSAELVSDAREAKADRKEIKDHSQIKFDSAVLSTDSSEIYIYLENTGQKVIQDLSQMDVLSNCTLAVPDTSFTNDTWIPHKDLNSEVATSA